MNELEKKSFYLFIALYLGSSLIFVLLSGYWYYNAQKNALENETFYKLSHIADQISSKIINAQMKGTVLDLSHIDQKHFAYTLIPIDDAAIYHKGYFEQNGTKVLVSQGPQEHLNTKYVIVKTDLYAHKLAALQKLVMSVMGIGFVLIIFVFIILAKLFMRPLHKRMVMIESFIQDMSHELNTPITALGMSSTRALQKGSFDKKLLTNILISTRQLESIYKSLAFLNFKQQKITPEYINLKKVLQQNITYYAQLMEAKHIMIDARLEDVMYLIVPTRAELLFSNLLSNAIKYSMPESTITIRLTKQSFSIEDQGIGIPKEKLETIFTRYTRECDIAGGFGVGLHIVQKICDTYGITIRVDSTPKQGTKFTLVFDT